MPGTTGQEKQYFIIPQAGSSSDAGAQGINVDYIPAICTAYQFSPIISTPEYYDNP
jgi:hypothetical protein